ncbi:hypothetical protein BC834DRAFT_57304 [Gloeopeniophorella convolvens]|nr:hypothetical protein BC834DRAFT_57304 [Gloeopeniophorella convolvens]
MADSIVAPQLHAVSRGKAPPGRDDARPSTTALRSDEHSPKTQDESAALPPRIHSRSDVATMWRSNCAPASRSNFPPVRQCVRGTLDSSPNDGDAPNLDQHTTLPTPRLVSREDVDSTWRANACSKVTQLRSAERCLKDQTGGSNALVSHSKSPPPQNFLRGDTPPGRVDARPTTTPLRSAERSPRPQPRTV